MAPTLDSYVSDVRGLIHDSQGKYFSDTQIIRYVNKARVQVVQSTGMNREVRSGTSYNWVTGIVTYAWTSDILAVVSPIFFWWNNTRFPLFSKSLYDLNLMYGLDVAFRQYPVAYAEVGRSILVRPIPDQAYTCEWDCIVAPVDFTGTTSGGVYIETENIIYPPYTEMVNTWAAYLAKKDDQSYTEANGLLNEYMSLLAYMVGSSINRKL